MSIQTPTSLEQYVDKDGRLTIAGLKLLESIVRDLRAKTEDIEDLQSRVTALEAP